MTHNLVLPFIMRAGGVKVSDIAKIHCEDPTVDNHCIIFGEGNESDLRIPLKLHGTFSYFDTRVPTDEELYNCNKYFIRYQCKCHCMLEIYFIWLSCLTNQSCLLLFYW